LNFLSTLTAWRNSLHNLQCKQFLPRNRHQKIAYAKNFISEKLTSNNMRRLAVKKLCCRFHQKQPSWKQLNNVTQQVIRELHILFMCQYQISRLFEWVSSLVGVLIEIFSTLNSFRIFLRIKKNWNKHHRQRVERKKLI
jgi:hypothetical protein